MLAASRGPQALSPGTCRQLCTQKVPELVELNVSVARASSILAGGGGAGGCFTNWKRMQIRKHGLWTLGLPGRRGNENSVFDGPRAWMIPRVGNSVLI